MNPFYIRRAVRADVPTLNKIVVAAAQQLNAQDYTQAQIDSVIKYVYGVDTQLVEDGTYFVAEADGRILGCGGWSKRKTLYGGDQAKSAPGEDTLLNPLSDAAKIRAFFVLPQYSRRGIGRALMGASEMAARQAGFKRLELLATLTGEPLYASVGFKPQERFAEILPDGVPFDVVRMTKKVEGETAVSTTPIFV